MYILKEVYPDIYQLEIPLVGNPLKAINSYIVLGDVIDEEMNYRECLVVDTGFNAPECRQVLLDGLKKLELSLENTKLFVTHLHSDHSGLAAELNKSGVAIYTGEIDGKMINQMTQSEYWAGFQKKAVMMDLLRDHVDFGHHPGYKYCPKTEIEYTGLKEGDSLKVGSFDFKILDIPGHTPGHIALYDENKKLLISGDHILDPITPNIAFWGFEWNILEVYFDSLEKVKNLEVDLVLSSHRKIITNHRVRIDELRAHHEERLEEVKAIIGSWTSIRDTASKMHWSLRAKDWSEFPDPQKWFASGEAMSHLEYLYIKGHAQRRENNGILEYKAKAE